MKKADVIRFFGTQENTAKVLKIKQPSVCKWGTVIPRLRALEIEKITKGKLKAE